MSVQNLVLFAEREAKLQTQGGHSITKHTGGAGSKIWVKNPKISI